MLPDFHFIATVTEPIAQVAPIAILAPFVGLWIGTAVARFVEDAGISSRKRAYASWAKRTWR
jgi:hypothetical protein